MSNELNWKQGIQKWLWWNYVRRGWRARKQTFKKSLLVVTAFKGKFHQNMTWIVSETLLAQWEVFHTYLTTKAAGLGFTCRTIHPMTTSGVLMWWMRSKKAFHEASMLYRPHHTSGCRYGCLCLTEPLDVFSAMLLLADSLKDYSLVWSGASCSGPVVHRAFAMNAGVVVHLEQTNTQEVWFYRWNENALVVACTGDIFDG